MKKLKIQIQRHGIFVASLIMAVVILLPLMRTSTRPMTIQEFMLLNLGRNYISVTTLRAVLLSLVLINLTLVYGLLSAWFAKRRAGLATFVLISMPVWLLMQIAMPRLTLVLTPTLIALWAFDSAGRSDTRAPLWYALCGVATTVAWLQEPIGVTILILVGLAVLVAIKPRYIKHITRQASLVLIILAATLAAVSAASWKFSLGMQDYLVRQLSHGVHITLVPRLYIQGPVEYYFGLPGVSLIPISITALAGLGAWQLFINRKRPRNAYLLILPTLLALISMQFTGITSLLLLCVGMVCVSIWAVMGVQYLHVSWKRVFPHNRLANSFGDLLIAVMLASLMIYSFWYINRGWSGNPQTNIDAKVEWNGTL